MIDLFRIHGIIVDIMLRNFLANSITFRNVVLALLFLANAALPGCGSPQRNESDKPRYIYLPPQTGSNVPRRVKVNPDGTLADGSVPSSVESGDARVLEEAQRKGQTVPGGR